MSKCEAIASGSYVIGQRYGGARSRHKTRIWRLPEGCAVPHLAAKLATIDHVAVLLDLVDLSTDERADLLVALDEALDHVRDRDPRQVRVVECRRSSHRLSNRAGREYFSSFACGGAEAGRDDESDNDRESSSGDQHNPTARTA